MLALELILSKLVSNKILQRALTQIMIFFVINLKIVGSLLNKPPTQKTKFKISYQRLTRSLTTLVA